MNRSLKKELLAMAAKDQEMRTSGNWDSSVDKENTKRLKDIIAKYGWPDRNLVGARASHMAWLLAQHADHDIVFQERCLRLIKQKSRRKTVKLSEVAYLTDRIRVHRGKKQLYGTQFYTNEAKELVPRTIHAIKDLDRRRKSMGLGSFEVYRKRLVNKFKSLHK